MENEKVKLVDFAVTARKYKTTLTKKFINRPLWVKHGLSMIALRSR